MHERDLKLIENLNNPDKSIRLKSLDELMSIERSNPAQKPSTSQDVNNHIHTTYSFSPYSPTKAIWMAYKSGLTTAGIMDHDSVSGAREFIEAGKIANVATTIGVECRVDFSKTALEGKYLNNPDQKSIGYIAIHGIPHTKIEDVNDFFKPIRKARNIRNSKMVDNINEIFRPFDISIDFEDDVAAISNRDEGGSITERHILFALTHKIIERYKSREAVLDFLRDDLGLVISPNIMTYLTDVDNPHYVYDLLGVFKSDLIGRIYIDATDECLDVRDVVEFAKDIGAIPAYAYLGDVEESPTGDKKAQRFEDRYIALLFETLDELGFNAVTYMPSRNSMAQLRRLKALCEEFEFFQISGEDINSPRQSFICKALREPEFKNLVDSTWALIGHEIVATKDIAKSFLSPTIIDQYRDLESRIKAYKRIGKEKYIYRS